MHRVGGLRKWMIIWARWRYDLVKGGLFIGPRRRNKASNER